MTAITAAIFFWLTIAPLPLVAGGSSERVVINQLTANGVDYKLVVTPANDAMDDPYLRHCKRFEVRGTHRWLRGALPLEENRPVEFGWIGTGFVPVDPTHPCIVSSRALRLLEDRGQTYVLSYHTSTSSRSD